MSIELVELALPLAPAVRGACEVLGLDPLHVANEGKLVLFVSAASVEKALDSLRRHPLGTAAARIGRVGPASGAGVRIRVSLGAWRPLDEPSGAPLPRIC